MSRKRRERVVILGLLRPFIVFLRLYFRPKTRLALPHRASACPRPHGARVKASGEDLGSQCEFSRQHRVATLQWSARVPYQGGTSSSCCSSSRHICASSSSMHTLPFAILVKCIKRTPVAVPSIHYTSICVLATFKPGNEPQSPVAPQAFRPPYLGRVLAGSDKLNNGLWWRTKHSVFSDCSQVGMQQGY
jgi:hypothetical protein